MRNTLSPSRLPVIDDRRGGRRDTSSGIPRVIAGIGPLVDGVFLTVGWEGVKRTVENCRLAHLLWGGRIVRFGFLERRVAVVFRPNREGETRIAFHSSQLVTGKCIPVNLSKGKEEHGIRGKLNENREIDASKKNQIIEMDICRNTSKDKRISLKTH